MLRSARHPYQATTVPQPQPQLHVKNPWSEKQETLSNSSGASRGGRMGRSGGGAGPPPASEWLFPRNQSSYHHGPLLNQQIHPVIVSSREAGSVAVSTVHGSSPAVSVGGGMEGCGGQCIACETFCYYCLQVLFIAGILTGISLTIAGSVLRGNHRGGDLMVLVYIGVLLALVCILLLSVHCCVRKKAKERRRALRLSRVQVQRRTNPPSMDFSSIPMQDFEPEPHFQDSCIETDLNHFDLVENQRAATVNVIPNPIFHSQIRSHPLNRSTMTRSHNHDWERQSYRPNWERQSYQPNWQRPNS